MSATTKRLALVTAAVLALAPLARAEDEPLTAERADAYLAAVAAVGSNAAKRRKVDESPEHAATSFRLGEGAIWLLASALGEKKLDEAERATAKDFDAAVAVVRKRLGDAHAKPAGKYADGIRAAIKALREVRQAREAIRTIEKRLETAVAPPEREKLNAALDAAQDTANKAEDAEFDALRSSEAARRDLMDARATMAKTPAALVKLDALVERYREVGRLYDDRAHLTWGAPGELEIVRARLVRLAPIALERLEPEVRRILR